LRGAVIIIACRVVTTRVSTRYQMKPRSPERTGGGDPRRCHLQRWPVAQGSMDFPIRGAPILPSPKQWPDVVGNSLVHTLPTSKSSSGWSLGHASPAATKIQNPPRSISSSEWNHPSRHLAVGQVNKRARGAARPGGSAAHHRSGCATPPITNTAQIVPNLARREDGRGSNPLRT
jgi:hypothetical protein